MPTVDIETSQVNCDESFFSNPRGNIKSQIKSSICLEKLDLNFATLVLGAQNINVVNFRTKQDNPNRTLVIFAVISDNLGPRAVGG